MKIMKNILYLCIIPLCLSFNIHARQLPVPVFVAEVEQTDFVDEIEALGTLQSNENVELTSTVTELVTSVNFTDGQRVRKGDILVEMDAAEERALRAEENSRLQEAKRQLKRLEPLVKRGAVSQAALDEQQLEIETARARIEVIDSQIRHRKIVAPFDGVVGQRNISAGALSQPGRRITTLDDDRVMKLDFAVPEVFFPALKSNTRIEARASAWPDEIFFGEISSLNSRIDPVTRSITVRSLLDNGERKLVPGMLMRVTLKKRPRKALVIPEEAIITIGNQKSVLVVVEKDGANTVKKVMIDLGTRRQGEVEVLSGLERGDRVVTHGNLRVRPGTEIVIKAVEKESEPLTELLNQKNEPEKRL